MEIKEQDLKEFAKTKINSLNKELQKWQRLLEALGEEQELQSELFPTKKPESISLASKPKIKSNPTSLRERCEKILFDLDVPLTSRELMTELEKKYNKKYDFYSFSGSFSQSYRKKNSLIIKYDLENSSKDVKAIYCLKNWLVGGELLGLYKDKIRSRYGITI